MMCIETKSMCIESWCAPRMALFHMFEYAEGKCSTDDIATRCNGSHAVTSPSKPSDNREHAVDSRSVVEVLALNCDPLNNVASEKGPSK